MQPALRSTLQDEGVCRVGLDVTQAVSSIPDEGGTVDPLDYPSRMLGRTTLSFNTTSIPSICRSIRRSTHNVPLEPNSRSVKNDINPRHRSLSVRMSALHHPRREVRMRNDRSDLRAVKKILLRQATSEAISNLDERSDFHVDDDLFGAREDVAACDEGLVELGEDVFGPIHEVEHGFSGNEDLRLTSADGLRC